MAKCANCSADALYVYEVTDSYELHYCTNHLPAFLNKLKVSGQLKTTEAFAAAKAEALEAVATPSSKKKTEPAVVEEPTADGTDS